MILVESTRNNPIYTIGYGSRDLDAVLLELKKFQIKYLVDIRTNPYSRYKPEFSMQSLKNFLEAQGIHYLYMGDTLGGQPKNIDCYRDGKVDYEKVAEQPFYLKGIRRLAEASRQKHNVVLMCSEEKPENCHRSKLIGKTLLSLGIKVLHIDQSGELLSQEEVILRLTDGQLSLFGDDFMTFTSRKKYLDKGEGSNGVFRDREDEA